MKRVIFSLDAASALRELKRTTGGAAGGLCARTNLRVVVKRREVDAVLASTGLTRAEVLGYSPRIWLLLWLRLLCFLGFGPACIDCAASPHARGMKLLALALRGHVRLVEANSDEEGTQLSLGRFLWLAWQTFGRRPGDVCLVGATSAARLQLILRDLRRRYAGARMYVLTPPECGPLDVDFSEPLTARSLLSACIRRPRFSTVVIPCAGDGRHRWKLLAWCLPLGFREIYNENNDSYPARELAMVFRHLWWRLMRRPNGVNVLGAGRPEQLERMVADVRRRHPDAHCHGFLTASLAGDAHRFDSVSIIRPLSPAFWLSTFKRAFGASRAGYMVLPFTREGHGALKFVFWFLPLGRREIYNENGDCYPGRDIPTLLRHLCWRSAQFIQLSVQRLVRIPDGVNVLGVASPAHLRGVVADVRRRHPAAHCHGFLPPSLAGCADLFDCVSIVHPVSPSFWLDVFKRAFGRRRAGYLVLPFTREGFTALKFVFWFLPLGRRELYNENYHLCSGRDPRMLGRHLLWRLRNPLRPSRIAVIGSASGYFMKRIVADLRNRYPGAPIHALLPARLVLPAAGLFDSYTLVEPLSSAFWRSLARLAFGRDRSGHLVVPCTNEGFAVLKFAGFCVPLGLRQIYNENADSYPARNIRMMLHHFFWRLRFRMFYQALMIRGGRSWPVHLSHLAVYPLRLVPGAFLLIGARFRAFLMARRRARASVIELRASRQTPVALPREDPFESVQPAVTTDHSGD